MGGWVQDRYDNAKGSVQGSYDNVSDSLTKRWEKAEEPFENLFGPTGQNIEDEWGKAKEPFESQNLKDASKSLNEDVRGIGKGVLGGLFGEEEGSGDLTMEGIAKRQQDRADEVWGRYIDIYGSKEKAFVDDSFGDRTDYGLDSRVIADTNRAVGGLDSSFSAADKSQTRSLSRMGMNPMSGKFVAGKKALDLDRAIAKTMTRNGTMRASSSQYRNSDFYQKSSALSLGKGLPATSAGMMSGAGATIGALENMRSQEKAAKWGAIGTMGGMAIAGMV